MIKSALPLQGNDTVTLNIQAHHKKSPLFLAEGLVKQVNPIT
jgi:hypothetical protein